MHCHVQINPLSDQFCFPKIRGKISNKTGASRTNNEADNSNDNNNDGQNDDQLGAVGGTSNDIVSNLDTDIDDEHPFHRECFAHRFGLLCVVCEKPLPIVTKLIETTSSSVRSEATTSLTTAKSNNFANIANGSNDVITTGGSSSSNRNGPYDLLAGSNAGSHLNLKWRRTTKVEFVKHPFFINERMCPHHVSGSFEQQQVQRVGSYYYNRSSRGGGEGGDNFSAIAQLTSDGDLLCERRTIRRCAGCHRFEPSLASQAKHFVDVGGPNSGQCVCLACCRTVVTTSEDAIPLWDKVSFYQSTTIALSLSTQCVTIIDDACYSAAINYSYFVYLLFMND